jgi:hypothetical protein
MTRRARRVVLDERTTLAMHVAAQTWLTMKQMGCKQGPHCYICREFLRHYVSEALREFDARRRGGEEEKG